MVDIKIKSRSLYMNKTLNKCKKEPNDKIYTPLDLSKDCISIIDINDDDILLDPFYGEGSFYNNYPIKNVKYWCEIEKKKDFFEYNNEVDWIISNPPFSKMNDVLKHCCKICKKGFGLIMLCTALTIKRIKLCSSLNFTIEKIMWFNVKSWFGFPCFFVVFRKNCNKSVFDIEPKTY